MIAPPPVAPRALLLDFVWQQSYGKTFSVDELERPPNVVPGLDAGGAAVPLARRLGARLNGILFPPPLPARRRRPAALDVQAVLYNALGIVRREPSHQYNDHRAYPSPRCLYTTHAHVAWAGDRGLAVMHYDPVGHRLRPVAGTAYDERALRELACEAGPSPSSIVLSGWFGGVPLYYRDLRYSLAMLELGHGLRNIALVADALALEVAFRLRFEDGPIRAALGWPESEARAIGALIELGGPDTSHQLLDASRNRSQTTGRITSADRLVMVDRACRQIPAGRRDPDRHAAALPFDGVGEQAPAPSARSMSLGKVLFERTSGRGRTGISPSIATIPASAMTRALQVLREPLVDGVPGHRDESPTGVRVLVAVERVAGFEDGAYEYHAADGQLRMHRQGSHLAAIEQASSSQLQLGGTNLVWLLVADFPRIVEQHGAHGIRLAHIEMGWIAQGLACALTVDGLFARPCRAFREPLLDELLLLGPSETVGYQIVCGVDRCHDVLWDLRC